MDVARVTTQKARRMALCIASLPSTPPTARTTAAANSGDTAFFGAFARPRPLDPNPGAASGRAPSDDDPAIA